MLRWIIFLIALSAKLEQILQMNPQNLSEYCEFPQLAASVPQPQRPKATRARERL